MPVHRSLWPSPKAIFFDVDFTLIEPGPTFRGEGYREFAVRHGMEADASRFEAALMSAAALLDGPDDRRYEEEIFISYIRRILEQMGARGPNLEACAREMYVEWAACRHFELYADVTVAFRALAAAGIRIGLISNSHRCLASFETHFELRGLIAAAVSSSEHGLMKPHPSIFSAALRLANVSASEAVMVGDSVRQDVDGALQCGMRAVLLQRHGGATAAEHELAARGVAIIRSLTELPGLVCG